MNEVAEDKIDPVRKSNEVVQGEHPIILPTFGERCRRIRDAEFPRGSASARPCDFVNKLFLYSEIILDFRSGLEPAAHTYLRATEFAPSLLGDLAAPCVAGLRAFGEQNRTTERAFWRWPSNCPGICLRRLCN